jgi:site-specific recombinase XerD
MEQQLTYRFLEEQYLKLVKQRGYKTGKGNQYPQAIREFFQFLRRRGYAYFEVTGVDMADYYEYLTTRPNRRRGGTLSATTINHHLFAIKVLFDFLLESKLISALPILPKYHKRIQAPADILTVQEIKLMYEACNSKLETALLSVVYGCGLRRTELSNLFLSDCDLQKGNLIVRHGKGDKRREVPMSNKVIADVRDYIHTERRTNHTIYHLFITTHGNAMSGYTMNEIIKDIAGRVVELEDKHITLHTMRRSIATHLTENGAGIRFVQKFLGHSDIDTSHLYAKQRKRRHSLFY